LPKGRCLKQRNPEVRKLTMNDELKCIRTWEALQRTINRNKKASSVESVFVLLPTLRIFNVWTPLYWKQRHHVTHFQRMHLIARPHYRMMCNLSRMSVCVNITLWCNKWAIHDRLRRVKEKSGSDLSLLLPKARKGLPGLIYSSDWRIVNNSTYVFALYALRKDLGFNPGIFGKENSNLVSAPSFLLVPRRMF
jgi:hypothetical protein